MTEQIIISLRALWPACMKDKSVYAIEDLHTMVSLSNLFFPHLSLVSYYTF